MATTNVFFEFPCFIDRWLVNNNINSNDANAQYFVNKNDIIGHVRLDNNSITSFRAPVSGYLTILIGENIRVAKGLNVAAIHPSLRTNANDPNHQITHIQNRINPQIQTQRLNTIASAPQTNMNHIIPPPQIHPPHSNNHPFHTQIRHPPHQPQVQHHIPMNQIPLHHHRTAPHPQFIPPPNHMQYHPFNPLPQQPHNMINSNQMYPNSQPPNATYHPQIQLQPQPQPPPRITATNIQRYPPPPPLRPAPVPSPICAPSNSNISPNNTKTTTNANSNMKAKSESSASPPSSKSTEASKYPTDPRKASIDAKRDTVLKIEEKASTKRETTPPPAKPVKADTVTSPNTMFTKHWNNKSAASNVENIAKIKMNLHKNKKLLLVLDIDHTLVHATRDVRAKDTLKHDIIKEDVYEISFVDPSCPANQKQLYWVKLRPFLRKFLQVLKRFFCLAIYTMGIRPYADEILKIIDPDSSIFEHRMICRGDSGINQVNGMKDISHLPQCDPKMILIADDRDDVWTTPKNVVKVHKFRYWPNEQNLADIIPQNDNDQEMKESAEKKPKPVFPWIQKEESMNLYANITPETKLWNYDRLKMKANDNILYNTANILQAVHYVYYSNPNKDEDCREIYGDMKQMVFRGVKCAFTGVIPTNEDPRNHPLWRLIESYGGEPVDCLSSDCTHLIAAKPGTFKVTKANSMNIWVLHYNWVYQSVVEFSKSDETKFTNLREPDVISSFVPKYVHVKPQEFGNTLKEIRNGTKQIKKIITKHEHQRIQAAKQKEIEQNRLKQEQQKQQEEFRKHQEQQQKLQQQKMQQELEQKQQEELLIQKQQTPQTPLPPLEKMNVDKKDTKDTEEGEVKETDAQYVQQSNANTNNLNSKQNNIKHPQKINNSNIRNVNQMIHNNVNHHIIHNQHNMNMNVNRNNNQKKEEPQPQNVTLVINNNTQNDIVIQLPPPNAMNTASKPNEIQVVTHESKNKSSSRSELPEYIQLPTRKTKPKAEPIKQHALPPHIALPEKNKQKILAHHQNTVSKVNLFAQPPKPQIIQITAPKLNTLRYTVPAIPQHLKQAQITQPIRRLPAIQSQNNYIPPSMTTHVMPHILPPPHVAIQQQHKQQQHKAQQQIAQQLVQPQIAQRINMSLGNHVNGLNMNINTNKVKEVDHRDTDYRTLKNKMKMKNTNKTHRDHSSSLSSDSNRSRSRERNRDRERYRHRDRDREKDKYHRYRRSRSRSRSRSHKHSSHSSSVSSRDRHKYRDREHSHRRREKKDRHHTSKYSIISPRRQYYDDPVEHCAGVEDEGDKYDDLLKSYMSYDCGNKYSKYSRYSDDEQQIDYGMVQEANNNQKQTNDSVDYGAI